MRATNFLSSATVLAAALRVGVTAVKVNPLPAPVEIAWGDTGPIKLADSIELISTVNDTVISDAWDTAYKAIKKIKWVPAAIETPAPIYPPFPTGIPTGVPAKRFDTVSEVTSIEVYVEDPTIDLQQGVDESYNLEIDGISPAIKLSAKTVWGALHGFTTLQQIVIHDPENGLHVEQPLNISDKPLYTYRGLMLDTGRNFLSVRKIKEQIRGMALAKMNVVHWHMTDTQSWPLHLQSYPQMVKDAYSPRESYSIGDLKDIISYARVRGIRVIPELDMPAHSNSGYKQIDPNMIACGNTWWSNDVWEYHTAVEPIPGHIDILYNASYEVVEKIHDEIVSIFPDNVVHVGGDEIIPGCYNFSVPTMEWLAEDPSRTYDDLLQYWIDHVMPIFQKHQDRRLMMWEDIVIGDPHAKEVPKDVILQSWNNGPENIKKIVSLGYDVVVASQDWLYLDCGYGGWVTNDQRYSDKVNPSNVSTFNYGGNGGSSCAPYKTWQRIYEYDFADGLTDEEKQHVLGASVAMWTEQADDLTISTRIWPRTAALGELLWSGNKDKDGHNRVYEMTQRIINFREYLLANGIAAKPLVPKYCVKNAHACDLNRNKTIVP
ncbi:hypothetical protein KEM54_000561 [Ascosphaera aggregata]|nr:hypothetical protein KEM54_000561 [Ascosphaera aggregata]